VRRSRVLLFVALLVLMGVVWFSPVREHLTRDEIRVTVEAVRATWYAPLLLVVMYAVGALCAVPASLFIIAAGAIWGWLFGGTLALVGGMVGAMASFFAGRFLGAALPERQGRTRDLLDRHLRDASFRSQLIVRLLPILPFAVVNYGSGIARVRTSSFFISTFLGLIPSNYVFAWSADEIFNGSLTGGGVMLRLFTVAAICVVAIAIPSAAARVLVRRPASYNDVRPAPNSDEVHHERVCDPTPTEPEKDTFLIIEPTDLSA
jgi:uncharacterized membrane protein YdjX (TVP38/TMEM64 family)